MSASTVKFGAVDCEVGGESESVDYNRWQ
jgi:hypothetical protein